MEIWKLNNSHLPVLHKYDYLGYSSLNGLTFTIVTFRLNKVKLSRCFNYRISSSLFMNNNSTCFNTHLIWLYINSAYFNTYLVYLTYNSTYFKTCLVYLTYHSTYFKTCLVYLTNNSTYFKTFFDAICKRVPCQDH